MCSGPLHEGVVDLLRGQHRAHRDDTVRQALGAGDEVRHHVEMVRGEGRAEPPEAGDDLVEDQEDAVLRADLPQPLEVALGRDQDAGGARHGLHDHGGHGLGAMQRHDPLQLIGQIAAMLGLTPGEGVLLGQMRVRQMVDAGQQ
jgi:hypothetical protein